MKELREADLVVRNSHVVQFPDGLSAMRPRVCNIEVFERRQFFTGQWTVTKVKCDVDGEKWCKPCLRKIPNNIDQL